MACDLATLTDLNEAARVSWPEIALDDKTSLVADDGAALLTSLGLRQDPGGEEVVMTRRDVRVRYDQRRLLVDAFDVALASAATGRPARLDRYRLPSRTAPYAAKAQDVVPRGAWALNPVVTLRTDALGGREALARLSALARHASREPAALFRLATTLASVGDVVSGSGEPSPSKAAQAWVGTGRLPGERDEGANRLLFPLSPEELSALGDGRFPHVAALRSALARLRVTASSQSKRPPAPVLLDGERTAALWASARLDRATEQRDLVRP